jgi:hypothetical protein
MSTNARELAELATAYAGGNYGMRNKIINGAMQIDQRNAGASVAISTANICTLDRWCAVVQGSGTGRFSVQRSTVAPAGFTNSTLITVTTADASPSSGFGYHFYQPIEGFNVADFALGSASAIQFTISFWVRSSVTGTFPFILSNEDITRNFGGTYTISSANTWEQKFVTVAGDITGTWNTSNSTGIRLHLGLGGGSARTASTGWQAGDSTFKTNVTGATQLIATNGATFYITGVQLEAGSVATPFERRPFGTELALCQRYYKNMQIAGLNSGVGVFRGSSSAGATELAVNITGVPMRANPTVTTVSGGTSITVSNLAGSSSSFSITYTTAGVNSIVIGQVIRIRGGSGLNDNAPYVGWNPNADIVVGLNAEL